MKKLLYMGIGALITILALGAAGFAYAQAQNPPTPQPPAGTGTTQTQPGWGMMGGMMRGWNSSGQSGMMNWRQGLRRGMMGSYARGFAQGSFGPMHEYMITALADKLGLTVEDLQAKIQAGETPLEIAAAQGLSADQVKDLVEQAHDEALKAAVAAGVLTQEQADFMDQRMESMWQNRGMYGRMGNSGGCPMNNQTTQP